MNEIFSMIFLLLVNVIQFFSVISPYNFKAPLSPTPGPRREVKLEKFDSTQFNFYYPIGYSLYKKDENGHLSLSATDTETADPYIQPELLMGASSWKENTFLTKETLCAEEQRLATKNKEKLEVLKVEYFETEQYRGCKVSVKHDANIFHGINRALKPDAWVITLQKTYWSKNPEDHQSYSFHASYRENNIFGNAQEIKEAFEKSNPGE